MYADTDFMFLYFQNSTSESQNLEDLFFHSRKPIELMTDLTDTTTISDYYLGGEGDLFKAPEPIMEEHMVDINPMVAAISMISCGEDVIPSHALKVTELIESEQRMSDVFYDCCKDLLEKAAIDTPDTSVSKILDNNTLVTSVDGKQIVGGDLLSEGPFQKSVSSDCLRSMDWINGPATKSSFLDCAELNIGKVYGMRRAYSEGDIKTLLGNTNGRFSHLSTERLSYTSEERMQKLSRYRNKKEKRNFGRKIKYACRKALAESQPRIRGRFAKTIEPDILKKQKLPEKDTQGEK